MKSKWDLKGTAISAGEGILYGVIDKVLKDQDALAKDATGAPAPRNKPLKTWADYFKIGTAIISAGVEATMPKYGDYTKPITGASFAFLAQAVWAYADKKTYTYAGTEGRVTYVPQRTGIPTRVQGAAGRAFAQQGVREDEVMA